MAQGAAAAARVSFEQACAIAPDRAAAHFQLACAHAALGERGPAEQSARAAIALDPGHAGAMHILGALLVEAGELDQATPWLRRAAELKPLPQVFRDLGATLAFAGDLDGAREALLRAIALDPLTKDAVDTLVRIQSVNDGSPAAETVRAIVDRLAGDVDFLRRPTAPGCCSPSASRWRTGASSIGPSPASPRPAPCAGPSCRTRSTRRNGGWSLSPRCSTRPACGAGPAQW